MVKTLCNTEANIQMLTAHGYEKSSVSKPENKLKNIRYDTIRKVYWYSDSKCGIAQDRFNIILEP